MITIKLIELNPGFAPIPEQRAHGYRYLDQYQQAIEDYDKVRKLDPDDEWPYHYKGMAYKELEQYELAIQHWGKYVELRLIESTNWRESEQPADAHSNIELPYIELGEYQKAIDHFDTALSIDPNYSNAVRGQDEAESLEQNGG